MSESSAPKSNAEFLGRGWSFPPAFEQVTGCVTTSAGTDNINTSIDLILHTPRGSRPLQPDYGSDLQRFVFRNADAGLREEIEQSVRATLLNDEPRIKVDQVTVDFVQEPSTTALINVHYTVRSSNSRHNHVFPFSLREGTNLQTQVG